MTIRINHKIWAVWVVATLPIAVLNLLLYITGVVQLK